MSWKREKLKNVCEFIDGDRGKNYPSNGELFDNGDCLFLNTGNVTATGFDFTSCQFIADEKDRALRKGKLLRGDVVLTTRGTLGHVAYYSDAIPFDRIRINSGMLIARSSVHLLPNYLFYAFRDPMFQAMIDGVRSGSAQPQLPAKTLKEMTIPVPTLEEQKRIADILSAYDKLIENNRRQIALLEEAAQRLYKEWFVDLRFPGYETVSIHDGLPEGWKRGKLADLLDDVGKRINKGDRDGFHHYLPIDSIPSHSFSCYESKPIDEAMSSLLAFNKGDIVFGAMRPYFHKVILAPYPGLTRSTCFVLREKDPVYHSYAFMTLFYEGTIRFATSISVGTTMPYVRWCDLKKMSILLPQCSIAERFNRNLESLFREIELLEQQIATAREARDRLLPKLMSGEIEVI